jgi:hypothetical protein
MDGQAVAVSPTRSRDYRPTLAVRSSACWVLPLKTKQEGAIAEARHRDQMESRSTIVSTDEDRKAVRGLFVRRAFNP